MAIAVPARHELKYYINQGQYTLLSQALGHVLHNDPNGDENNEYHIRSLYFDTFDDAAMHDKLNGIKNRDKYRIRIYNHLDSKIQLECKSKLGSLISKRSLIIPLSLAEQLIAGDPSGLERTSSGLLRDMYREMTINLLRPVVIVDYVREAYTHPAEEVRITFDKKLRTGLNSTDLFNPDIPTIPVQDAYSPMILEVKYNRFLPSYIRNLLTTYCQNPMHSAISKYTLCRSYEGFVL